MRADCRQRLFAQAAASVPFLSAHCCPQIHWAQDTEAQRMGWAVARVWLLG